MTCRILGSQILSCTAHAASFPPSQLMTKRTGAAPKAKAVPRGGGRSIAPAPPRTKAGVQLGGRGRGAKKPGTVVRGGRGAKPAAAGAAAAGSNGGRGGRAKREPKPSQAQLDADLDSYMATAPPEPAAPAAAT